MLARKLVALAVIALAPAALSAAEPDNPFKNAEKGQWVSFKMTGKFGGMETNGTIKQTVLDKTDKAVTVEATISINGMDFPPQKKTIDLTKPFDPLSATSLPVGGKAKSEKKESGKETIEA